MKVNKKANKDQLLIDSEDEKDDKVLRILNDLEVKEIVNKIFILNNNFQVRKNLYKLTEEEQFFIDQDKQQYFGISSSEEMLFGNFNYLIAQVTLDIDDRCLKSTHDEELEFKKKNAEDDHVENRPKNYAPKTIEILVKNHNIGDILKKAKNFWKIDSDKFVLQNDKRITLSNEELVWDIFYYTNQKLHRIQFYLCHKYKYFHSIIKLQQDCFNKNMLKQENDKKPTNINANQQELLDLIKVKRNQQKSVKENYKIFFEKFPKIEEYIDKEICKFTKTYLIRLQRE